MNKQIGNYERRTEALWEIAKQDEVYQLWFSEYEKHRSKYQSIRRFLPKKLRYFLDSYISYNSVMLNRVISIACMCMEGTSKNSPFAIFVDLFPQLFLLKTPQYTKYSGVFKT